MNKISPLIFALFLCFFSISYAFASEHISEYSEDANVEHSTQEHKEYKSKTLDELVVSFVKTTGLYALIVPKDNVYTSEPNPKDERLMSAFEQTLGRAIMFFICLLLFYDNEYNMILFHLY